MAVFEQHKKQVVRMVGNFFNCNAVRSGLWEYFSLSCPTVEVVHCSISAIVVPSRNCCPIITHVVNGIHVHPLAFMHAVFHGVSAFVCDCLFM